MTPLLVQMTETGVRLDPAFIQTETAVLVSLMENLSSSHERLYGRALGAMDDHQIISWLFGDLGSEASRTQEAYRSRSE